MRSGSLKTSIKCLNSLVKQEPARAADSGYFANIGIAGVFHFAAVLLKAVNHRHTLAAEGVAKGRLAFIIACAVHGWAHNQRGKLAHTS